MRKENLLVPNFFLNGLSWIVFTAMMLIALQAQAADQLVGFETASKNGLERAWFSQVRVDRSKNRVTNWALHDDLLLALTSTGTLHAMDSESGRTRWVAQVGNPSHPSTGPAANAELVAVLNGSRLFMLDRGDGHLVWSRPIGNISEAAPVLGENYAYVAQINGRVEGFKLDDPAARVWQYQSLGRIYHPPIIAGELVAWTSDRGHLYFGNAIRPRVSFRVETYDEIAAAPTASGENLYATSLGGYLYCYTQAKGAELWRFSAGRPITKKPTVVGDRVYVASEAPALYAVDSTSGHHAWTAEGVVQFVARGANRVYGLDRFGTLLILDGESGTLAGRIATGGGFSALANEQSDRIFLVSDSGLVQCLHELGAEKPILHSESASEGPMSEKGEQEDASAEEADESTEEMLEEESGEDFDDEDPFGDANPFG